jgi:hypothetical protein
MACKGRKNPDMVKRLEAKTAQWLLEQPFEEPVWVVEDLIPTGLHLLVGPPKIGKSWLVLSLGLAVSLGEPFWGFATRRSDVLYLCLEDTFQRVQKRLWMITDTASEGFFFANAAQSIGGGLCEQLSDFKEGHPELRLVFIDTLQMVRDASRESLYAADYGDLSKLKQVADGCSMAVVVIHHTRKMGDSDALNTVSGTTGITGSADSTLVLQRQTRSAGDATITITGRDVEFQELKLRFKDCRWELLEKTSTEELEERDVPDEVLQVLSFMDGRESWSGSARELLGAAGIGKISAAVLGKYMAQHQAFLASRGVGYSRRHARSGNVMELARIGSDEGSEGCEG